MKKQKHLIIGAGEVGKASQEVLKGKFLADIQDATLIHKGQYDVLHICYPPVKNFVSATKKYIKIYRPGLVIVHSTVPVGTTRKIASFAVHSPIRGVHPHLAKGIRTFVKYFGGKKAKEATEIFSALGVPVKVFSKPETTELLKILDTTYYGWNIIFAKEVKRICDKLKLDFDEVYTDGNISYNQGYTKLGKPNVVRPVLLSMKGKIGGHCIMQNCDLLDDWLTKTVKQKNKKY